MRGLDYLIEHLCTKEKDCNIKYLSIKKAIKYKSFDKMKQKDKFKQKKTTEWKGSEPLDTENPWDEDSYNSSWVDTDDETGGGQTYFDFGNGTLQTNTDPETCTRVSSILMEVQSIYNPENYYDFEEFIGEKLFSNEAFSKGAFYLISSADTFNLLRKMNLVLSTFNDLFYFNQNIINDSRFKIWEELYKNSFDAIAFYNIMLSSDTFTYDDIKNIEIEKDAVNTANMIRSLLTKELITNKKGIFYIND
jgi:hypothetical protein